jgi:hypothetical protein
MTGSLDQFVLIKASKSLGGVWADMITLCVIGIAMSSSGASCLPAGTERPAVVLDDNGTRNPTVRLQSGIFSDTRTGDGGF